MLNIYKIVGQGRYGGGVVLVAANTPKEAAAIGNRLSGDIWNVVYKQSKAEQINNINYSGVGNEAQVILHYEMGE